jgi:3-deoxy-7-phosphoheptulonate synthase
MLVIMKNDATEAQTNAVIQEIAEMGFRGIPIPGAQCTAVCIVGNQGAVDGSRLISLEGVKETIRVSKQYKLVSREIHAGPTTIKVGNIEIGGGQPAVIAGPCSIESEKQALTIAALVKAHGARLFRGGAFKPRTSPYAFQGMGEKGLKILQKVREETGLAIVTEATDPDNLRLVEQYTDVIQIGARNMQNYSLLRRAGRAHRPVLLKRGFAATIEELLMAAEYIASEGNNQIIFCERGIRTFSDNTRNTLDLGAVLSIKEASHLPVIVDPSHAAGRRDFVIPLSRAAIAVGADGIIVEVHNDPAHAMSDGLQSLYPEQFGVLMREIDSMSKLESSI